MNENPVLREIGNGHFNPDMLKLAIEIRGLSIIELAKAIGVKRRIITDALSGKEPPPDVMERIGDELYFPRQFFFQAGVRYERDPRYPLDMFVPLPLRPPPTREALIALIADVGDDDLQSLHEFMHEIAIYPENVVRLGAL